jgi:hypothetical protein
VRGGDAWKWVSLAAVLVVAILAGAWLIHGMIIRPAGAVRDGVVYVADRAGQALAEVYRDGKQVARRLLNGEVTSHFSSYVASTQQVNKLLLVERIQLEHFHEAYVRGPSRAELDLLVPVEYQYYVDMGDKSAWAMAIVNGELRVVAPALQVQRPNPHWENRREFIQPGMLIRGEVAKMAELKDRIVAQSAKLARRPVRMAEARNAARESLANWLREWVETSLLNEFEVRAIAVRFADEPDFPPVRYGLAVPTVLPPAER